MEPVHAEHLVAGFVVAALVLSGPLGVMAPGTAPTVSDGDADVTLLTDPAGDLRVTPGRFGTDVAYLRIPPVDAAVDAVSGHPELVYEVRVPALDVEARDRQVLDRGMEGRVRLHLTDRARPRDRLDRQQYRARVVVRLQSLSGERTIYNRTATVEVQR